MNDIRSVQLEWLRPHQIAAQREKADIAFLPLGSLEWHGLHNPIGLDVHKIHHICCLAAQIIGGGVVAPPLVWGLPRDSFFVDKANPEVTAKVALAYGTDDDTVRVFSSHGGMDTQEQWLFYQRLLRMSLEHLAGYGFRSIYVATGHGRSSHHHSHWT